MNSHHVSSNPPISTDHGPAVSRATPHLDAANVLHVHRIGFRDKRTVTINILPNDVLLLIFHFIRMSFLDGLEDEDEDEDRQWHRSWHWLVHVCQRWRSAVFASPKYLDLRLVCGPNTPTELTGIWPPLPIIIKDMPDRPMPGDYDFDAAIVHPSRVFDISLFLTRPQLLRLVSVMQEQFPALAHLSLGCIHRHSGVGPPFPPALPDGFLGGSALHLRSFELDSISFPALPKLLLSATHLVRLKLRNFPDSGYISPEAIVTCLAALADLKYFTILFGYPLNISRMESRRPPPPTRVVLPALTRLEFQGSSDYLLNLVARVDVPLLDNIRITFLHPLISNVPQGSQLAQFMRRTTRFDALEAHVDFKIHDIEVEFLPPTWTFGGKFGLRISSRDLDWQISSLARVFASFFPSIDMVQHLYIYRPQYLPLLWQDGAENMELLRFFHPFTGVKNLYVCKQLVQRIATALQEPVGESVTDLLPALEILFVEELQPSGPVRDAIGQFVAARELSGHPVAVSDWNRT